MIKNLTKITISLMSILVSTALVVGILAGIKYLKTDQNISITEMTRSYATAVDPCDTLSTPSVDTFYMDVNPNTLMDTEDLGVSWKVQQSGDRFKGIIQAQGPYHFHTDNIARIQNEFANSPEFDLRRVSSNNGMDLRWVWEIKFGANTTAQSANVMTENMYNAVTTDGILYPADYVVVDTTP